MENEKIQEILKDKKFSSQVLKMETPEEVQKAFKQKGLELSLDEIGIIGDLVNSMIARNSTDLSEEDLEEIAGGFNDGDPAPYYPDNDTVFDEGYSNYPSQPSQSSGGICEIFKKGVERGSGGNITLTNNQTKALMGGIAAVGVGVVGISAIGLGAVAVGGYKAVKWAGKKIFGRR